MPKVFLLKSIFILVFQCAGIINAQWRGPLLTPLRATEGLPTVVNSIVTDSTGFIYFASNIGLYRYDGHSLTFYGPDPLNPNTLGSGEILNMIAGRDGTIWMALRFGGLNSFDPKTGLFKRYPLPELNFRTIPSAIGLFEDPDGTIWVGATHFRLLAFDRKTEQYTLYMPDWIDPQQDRGRLSILSITPDVRHPDSLWLSVLDYHNNNSISRSYGQVIFRKSKRTFEKTSLAGVVCYTDPSGVMWAKQWGNYITRLDPLTSTMDTFQHHFYHNDLDLVPLTRDITSYNGKIIVASSLALMVFDTGRFSNLLSVDRTDEIYSLFSDPNQNLWIGTHEGVLVLDPDAQHIRFFSLDKYDMYRRIFPGRLTHDPVTDILYLSIIREELSDGYFSIPLGKSEKENDHYISTRFPVQPLAIDHHRTMWMVGDGTLYHQDLQGAPLPISHTLPDKEKPLPGAYMSCSKEGWLGIVGAGEFVWLHPDSSRIRRLPLKQLPGNAYAKSFDNAFDGFSFSGDQAAYLFSNELHRVDLRTGDVTVLRFNQAVNPNYQRIQSVVEDPDGYIWMSTFVHTGKYQLVEDSLILLESFGIQQGMIGAGAMELHADHAGRIWAFCQSGLNAIDPHSSEVRFFGTKEGLPFPYLDPRQVISTADGRIATVCHNGVIVFDPVALWNSASPRNEPVVIKRLRINGQEIRSGISANFLKHIELKHNNRGFDIEFQALAFPTDYKMEYSYRIMGLQDNWISIGGNQLITLPALASGQYTLEIKAGNPLSPAPVKTLIVTVPEPWYQKLWFISLAVAVLVLALYAFLRYRIHRIRQLEESRTAINKEIAELELKALRAQMNPHFMFNSLNSIKNYILHAEPKLAAEYLSNFAHLIRMILQNSREKAITLQEELETLILYIELEQIRFENKFEFTCEISDDVPMEQTTIPPMLLQPFVENAIWHGLMHKKENGHLALRFIKNGDRISCVIEDDGIGRKKAADMKSLSSTRYKSMGMGITRDRIEIMNKMDALGITIDVMDKTNPDGTAAGTSVIVNIPSSTEI